MKQLILFIFLTFTIYPQSSELLILMSGGYKNPETTLYLTGQTVTPTQAIRIDNLITMLKDSLSISLLSSIADVILIYANETQPLALRNLVKRDFDATAVNSPAFVQWEGYTGATGKYITLDYNPSADGVTFKQNDASVGCYFRVAEVNTNYSLGCGDGSNLIYFGTRATNATFDRVYLNSTSYAICDLAGADAIGFKMHTRTSSTAINNYNNSAKGSNTDASEGVPNVALYALGYNNNGSAVITETQLSMVWIGKSLDDTQVRKVKNCIEWYMDDLGKGVIP